MCVCVCVGVCGWGCVCGSCLQYRYFHFHFPMTATTPPPTTNPPVCKLTIAQYLIFPATIPYSGLFSYGRNDTVEHHIYNYTKIKTAKLFNRNRFNVTILSCTNIQFNHTKICIDKKLNYLLSVSLPPMHSLSYWLRAVCYFL